VAAQTAAANAAFWAATIFGWPIAAGWYGAAAFWGEIAKDPPAPDENYTEQVAPSPVPDWPVNAVAGFTAWKAFLHSVARLAMLENATTVVLSRILGARLAGDESWQEMSRRWSGKSMAIPP
jgi:hypothetical protein